MPAIKISKLIDADIGRFRRVGHSGQQWFTSIDRQSFGFAKTSEQALNAAGTFAGTAGAVSGAVAIGMSTTAATAVVGAGFLAAVAGPQVAVTAAVVALAVLIKGAYSNREAAHKKLLKHVWTMVDDTPPEPWTQDSLNECSEAAMTLMEDGKNQIKLLGSKLEAAKARFMLFNKELEDLDAAKSREDAIVKTPGPQAARAAAKQRMDRHQASMEAAWRKAISSGGAVADYVRRISHTGNYIQAPHIIAIGMKLRMAGGFGATVPPLPTVSSDDDFFKGMANVIAMRYSLAEHCKRYDALGLSNP